MKVTSMIVGAFAALATAAPAPTTPNLKARGLFNQNFVGSNFGSSFNSLAFNDFGFQNQVFGYLGQLNFIDPNILIQLAQVQNLAFDNFDIFNFNQGGIGQFGINELFQLHTLATLSWFGRNGLLDGINFNGVTVPSILEVGLLQSQFDPLSNFNFGIDAGLGNQLAAIVQQTTVILKE